MRIDRLLAVAALAMAGALPLGLGAQLTPKVGAEVPMRDPWVPLEVREKAKPGPETTGAELQAQVDRKLRARFDAVAKDGRLTREQARAGGLGSIADRFDAIDTAGRGYVTYDEYRHYLLR